MWERARCPNLLWTVKQKPVHLWADPSRPAGTGRHPWGKKCCPLSATLTPALRGIKLPLNSHERSKRKSVHSPILCSEVLPVFSSSVTDRGSTMVRLCWRLCWRLGCVWTSCSVGGGAFCCMNIETDENEWDGSQQGCGRDIHRFSSFLCACGKPQIYAGICTEASYLIMYSLSYKISTLTTAPPVTRATNSQQDCSLHGDSLRARPVRWKLQDVKSDDLQQTKCVTVQSRQRYQRSLSGVNLTAPHQ